MSAPTAFNTGGLIRILAALLLMLTCSAPLSAQRHTTFKLGVETGFLDLAQSNNRGLFLYLEPRIQAADNLVIGLRIGATLNSQTIQNTDSLQYFIYDEYDDGTVSVVPTIDYHWEGEKLSPFVGIGVGYHLMGNPIEVTRIRGPGPFEGPFLVSVRRRVGFLLRGGFERRHFRLGLEYNLIPKGDINVPDGPTIGAVDISYLGLSFGYVIEGRSRTSK